MVMLVKKPFLRSAYSIAIGSAFGIAMAVLGAARPAAASVTYDYTGNDFTINIFSPYTHFDSVTGFVTFSTALPASLINTN